MIILKYIIYLISTKYSICDEEITIKSTLPLPNFRKQMEEVTVEKTLLTQTKDENQNLVSFLVKNIKEIFGESEEPTVLLEPDNDNDETTFPLQKTTTISTSLKVDEENFDMFDESEANESLTESNHISTTSLTIIKHDNSTTTKSNSDVSEKTELLNLSKDLVILQKAEQEERENQALETNDASVFNKSLIEKDMSTTRRSCISCNNIAVMECYDPKNRLIPSIVCEREEDLCYSQHTPFGIVDRACFNVNHNLTTYVCSCNLCNFISISEMPYIFSTKRDWAENVIELSRTRRLKKTVFKDMSCLRCEVSKSTKTGDMLDNANCLEGNVGTLPIQECAENEICGIKAIRSEGYIWRGCLTEPLYNYWWTLCDSDLCNYDSLVSIYDVL